MCPPGLRGANKIWFSESSLSLAQPTAPSPGLSVAALPSLNPKI